MSRTDKRGIPYLGRLLARLRASRAAGLNATPELIDQVIAALASEVSSREQLRSRNRLVRRASLLLPNLPSDSARAAELADVARTLPRISPCRSRAASNLPVVAATVRECLQEAAAYGRLPTGQRQFFRILLSSPGGD